MTYVRMSPTDVEQLVDEVKRERRISLAIGVVVGVVIGLVLGVALGFGVARHQERQRDAEACELAADYLGRPVASCVL